MMRFTFYLLLVFVISGSSSAMADKKIFDINHGSGSTEFEAIGRPGALKIHGKGTAPHGTLSIDGSLVSGDLTFDLDSLDTGIKMRNEHMKKKYLETEKFPQAKITLKKVNLPKDFRLESCAIGEAQFEGVLSLHGVEKPINGQTKIDCKDGQVSLEAHFGFAVDDFNIAIPSFAGVTMAKDVKVSVIVQAPTVIAVK